MTVVFAIAVLSIFALLVIVTIVAMDKDRHRRLSRSIDQRAEDLDTFREQTAELMAGFARAAVSLSARDSDDLRAVIDALISDRDRLVTALLSSSANPTAARVLGMVDQANGSQRREASLREFLDEQMRAGRDTETMTSDGESIIPVGLGSS